MDGIGWTVSVQSYVGHRLFTKKKPPPVIVKWFATRQAAEDYKRLTRARNPSPDCLICITPAEIKRGKVKEKSKP